MTTVIITKLIFFYRLVGDNVDMTVHARIQSKDNPNKSIHWTQQYGVLNRVNEPLLNRKRPQKALKHIQLVELLPGKEVNENLKLRWAALVARVVCKYLQKHLSRALVHHTPHTYSTEMSTKSEMVSKAE